MSAFIEALEARELLSASPAKVPHKASATIVADQAAIIDARDKIRTDQANNHATLVTDQANIRNVRKLDQAAIRADTIKLRQDRGNPTAVEADKGKILIDKSTLTTDINGAQAKVKTDRDAGKALILADQQALKAAQTKLRNDRIAGA